jgi:hypothetical protein
MAEPMFQHDPRGGPKQMISIFQWLSFDKLRQPLPLTSSGNPFLRQEPP